MRKAFAILLSVVTSHFLHAQYSADTIFTQAERMPFFAGCSDLENDLNAKRQCSNQELVRFISRYLLYPEIARETGIEGTVYVSFVIDEQGKLTQPGLLMDIGGGCGQAALNLLSKMPVWEPGVKEGRPVRVKLNLPIQFNLRDVNPDLSEGYTLTWGGLKGDEITAAEIKQTLKSPLFVRDPLGNDRYVDELAFTFEKNKKLYNATSRGEISPELAKIVDKTKKGGTFTITASVQDRGRFIYVTRSFSVIE